MAIVVRVEQQGSEEPSRKTTQPFNLKSAKKAAKKKDVVNDPAEPDADDELGFSGKPDGDPDDAVEASQVKKNGSDKAKTSKHPAKVGTDANADPVPPKGKARFGRPGSPIQF
jgi:hypothetical protein